MKTEINGTFNSKINFTAVIQFIITALITFGIEIDPELQVKILTTSGMAGPILVTVFRTWFTNPKV